ALEEQGAAHRLANGFVVPTADAVRLGRDEREILDLPQRFPGTFRTELTGDTTTQRFAVALRPELDGSVEPLVRDGAIITIGTSNYLLSLRMLRAIAAVERHAALPREARTETANVRLVAELQDRKSTRLNSSHV